MKACNKIKATLVFEGNRFQAAVNKRGEKKCRGKVMESENKIVEMLESLDWIELSSNGKDQSLLQSVCESITLATSETAILRRSSLI